MSSEERIPTAHKDDIGYVECDTCGCICDCEDDGEFYCPICGIVIVSDKK